MKKNLFYVFILIIVFLVHLSYIPNGFVWLDHGDIEMGRAVMPLEKLPSVLFTRFGDTGFYRPIVTLTESVDSAFYNEWATGFHLTNVLLHLIVTALVPLFLAVFFRLTFFEVLLIMLLVGVHPLTWLPVGAISYRPELLLTIFVMLTVYLHAKARTTGKSHFEFFAIISFFLALLSKETAIFLIPVIIVLWETLSVRVAKVSRVSLFLSEIIVTVLYFILRVQAVPEIWRVPQYDLSWTEAIGTRFGAFSQLLMEFISPFKPDLSDAVVIRGIDIFVIFGCLSIVMVVILIIKKAGIFSPLSGVLLLFIILLIPALSIVPVPRLGSSHYGYIALPAFAGLIILLFRRVRSGTLKNSMYSIFFAWMCFMSFNTFIGGFQFKNDLILFAPEVKKDPNFLEGYFYLGNYYLLNNNLRQAEDMYKKALVQRESVAYNEKQSVLINLEIVQEKLMKKGQSK